jgi:hypothetical protein
MEDILKNAEDKDKVQREREAFLADYDKITKELAVKHGLQLVPVLQYTPTDGLKPMFDIIKVDVEGNAKTITPTDKDDSVS